MRGRDSAIRCPVKLVEIATLASPAVLVLSGMSCRHQWHLRSSLLALFVRTLRHVHQVAAWRGPASTIGKVSG